MGNTDRGGTDSCRRLKNYQLKQFMRGVSIARGVPSWQPQSGILIMEELGKSKTVSRSSIKVDVAGLLYVAGIVYTFSLSVTPP